MERKYLTVKEAAEYMRVSPNTVYNWVQSGRLYARRAGSRLRFTTQDLDDWLEGRATLPTVRRRK
jgi:excisionase family DNA binding protein